MLHMISHISPRARMSRPVIRRTLAKTAGAKAPKKPSSSTQSPTDTDTDTYTAPASPSYPGHMDLGESFYRKLFAPEGLKQRRRENMEAYPPQEEFMKMLPRMDNADAHQFSIYWDGVYGKLPALPVDPELLTKKFIAEADPDAVVWLMGRAGSKQTYYDNQSDFDNWKLVPRMMTGLQAYDSTVKFNLGKHSFTWSSPIAVAPVGVQARVAEKADLVACVGAAQVGIPFIVSSVSSTPLESISQHIKEANPDAPAPWFQLYNSSVPALSMSMLRRAKEAGYGAVVVTLDTVKYGYRTEELDAAYFPQADTRFKWCQMTWDPVFNAILKEKLKCVASEEFSENGKYPVDRLKANLMSLSLVGCSLGDKWTNDEVVSSDNNGYVTEEATTGRENNTMKWFCKVVKDKLDLPLIMKGIMHPEDARLALEHGADGIVVSNHGGRQVDGSISTIEALPGIIKAVRQFADCRGEAERPVFLDSGVRYGQHVVKALALGATGVLVGRMPIIGASLGGVDGVKHVLLSLSADMQCTMVNCGYDSISSLQKAQKLKLPLVRSASVSLPPHV